MANDKTAERYRDAYKKLLRLYPKPYRKQLAEPMLQTFSDLYREHRQAQASMFSFVFKTYVDTGIGILKEHSKEMAMSSKKTKIFIGAGGVVVLAIVGTFVILHNRHTTIIPPGTYLKQVRELSKGKKEACLANNEQATAAVRKDDTPIPGYKDTNFDITPSAAIADVPAGTNYDLTINSYDGHLAKGTLAYEKGYGTYNYTVRKLAKAGQWELVSTVACQK